MSASEIAVTILLAITVLGTVLSALGLLWSQDFYERLHYLAPAATVGVSALAAAIVIQEALGQAGIKAIFIAVLVLFMNAVLTHATARAGRIRQYGQWMPQSDEEIQERNHRHAPTAHPRRQSGREAQRT